MAFSMVTVTGKWSNSYDEDATGSVTFLPTAAMENGTTIPQSPVCAFLVNGEINVQLAANDDPGTIPSGAAYHVIEIINEVVRKYVIVLKHSEPVVDLPSIAKGQVAPVVEYPAIWT